MDEIWVLEFSPIQKTIHVSTLNDVVRCNRKTIKDDVVTGYIPVFASKDEKEVRKCAEVLMNWRDSKFFEEQEMINCD